MSQPDPNVSSGLRVATIFRLLRSRTALAILFVLCAAAGFRLLLPAVVERAAAWGSRHYLGLPARIANADLALWDGGVVLEGVSLGAAPDDLTPARAAFSPPPIARETALVYLDRISVRWSWRALLSRTVRLREVVIESPSVRLQREADGLVDPLRNARPAAHPSPAADGGPSAWALAVDQFSLRSPDVKILNPANGDKLLEFSLEKFDLSGVVFRAGEFALESIGIEGPLLRVRRNLVDEALAGNSGSGSSTSGSAGAGQADASAPSAPAPGYRIKKVDVARATFTWVTDDGPLDVNLDLKASGITAELGKKFPIELAVRISDGEISARGDVGVFPPSFDGKLSWQGLPFPPLLLAAHPGLAAWLKSADSAGDLLVQADLGGDPGGASLRMSGRASLDSFAIADPAGGEVGLGWSRLEVVGREVVVPIPEAGRPLPAIRIDLESVRLSDPKVSYTHPASALSALLGPSTGAEASGPPPLDLRISSLELSGGEIDFHDRSVSPSATSTVRELAVSLRDIRFPDLSADAIDVRALLPPASRLEVSGGWKPGNQGDFSLALQAFDLPPVSPYAAAAGATLDAGQFFLKMKLKVRGPVIEADNDLILRRLGISLRDPGSFDREFGMPIDLALALLNDPSGDIRLKIPVRIDEKGTSISKSAVIGSALKAALLGSVTTPLKLLGGTLGGKPGSPAGGFAVAPIVCLPGSGEPDPKAAGRLDGLVKLLSQKPAIALQLRGRTGPDDLPLLAQKILIERLESGLGLPEVADAGFLARRRISKFLQKPGGQLSPKDQALFQRYLTSVEVPPARLDDLANSRAAKVRDLLIARGVSSKRLSLGKRDAAGQPGVVVSFQKP